MIFFNNYSCGCFVCLALPPPLLSLFLYFLSTLAVLDYMDYKQ